MQKHYQSAVIQAFFALALIILGIILAASWYIFSMPYDGVLWSARNGIVDKVAPNGPGDGLVFPGDRILAIGERRFPQINALYAGMKYGDPVMFTLERGGREIQVVMILASPSLSIRFNQLMPCFVSLTFWAAGLFVFAFKLYHRQSILFFLVCQAGALTLTTGSLTSVYASLFFFWLYGALFWWIVPLIAHFHIYFPSQNVPTRPIKIFVWGLYLVAAIATLPYLITPSIVLGDLSQDHSLLYTLRRLWLAVGLSSAVFLLWRAYVSQTSAEARQKIKLLILGAALALSPFLNFSLLPDALFHYKLLSYNVSSLFLIFIPFSYVYAILRYRLIPLDRFISRAAASVITLTLLVGVYWLTYTALNFLLPLSFADQPTRQLLIVLILVVIYVRSANRVASWVDRLFYGGGADYPSLVKRASKHLAPASDPLALSSTLLDELQEAMQIECSCLLMGGGSRNHTEHWLVTKNCRNSFQGVNRIGSDAILTRFFAGPDVGPLPAVKVRQNLSSVELGVDEAQLLNCPYIQLWFPLSQTHHTRGLLILGPRRGGGRYPTAALEVLDIIIRQASISLENTHLIRELNQRNRERTHLSQQMLRVREDERKTLSRNLHDNIIQTLIGLDIQISQARRIANQETTPNLDQLQKNVRGIVSDLRKICSDLRPPVLDSMGLVAAIRYLMRIIHQETGLEISLVVDGDEEQSLPEDVELCLFRVLQEALNNIQRHAGFCQVGIHLCIRPDTVIVEISDDGVGFVPPEHVGSLLQSGHFGLVGIREQVELVKGKFSLESAPGTGSRMKITIPFLPASPPSDAG